jgi:hypothetical protein
LKVEADLQGNEKLECGGATEEDVQNRPGKHSYHLHLIK